MIPLGFMKASPPVMRMLVTDSWLFTYAAASSTRRFSSSSLSPTIRLRKQWRQYMAHWLLLSSSTVWAYLCCRPSSLVLDASPLVSKDPPGSNSSREGMHIRPMGSWGSPGSTRER